MEENNAIPTVSESTSLEVDQADSSVSKEEPRDAKEIDLENRLKIFRRDNSWKKRELRKHEAYVGPSMKRNIKSLEAARNRSKNKARYR